VELSLSGDISDIGSAMFAAVVAWRKSARKRECGTVRVRVFCSRVREFVCWCVGVLVLLLGRGLMCNGLFVFT
jgi:hypothetical protein